MYKLLLTFTCLFMPLGNLAHAGEVTIATITHHVKEKGDFTGYTIQHSDNSNNKLIIYMADPKTLFLETFGEANSWWFSLDPSQKLPFLTLDPKISNLDNSIKADPALYVRAVDLSHLKSTCHLCLSFSDPRFNILVKIVKGEIAEVSQYPVGFQSFIDWPKDYDSEPSSDESDDGEIKALPSEINYTPLPRSGNAKDDLALAFFEELRRHEWEVETNSRRRQKDK